MKLVASVRAITRMAFMAGTLAELFEELCDPALYFGAVRRSTPSHTRHRSGH